MRINVLSCHCFVAFDYEENFKFAPSLNPRKYVISYSNEVTRYQFFGKGAVSLHPTPRTASVYIRRCLRPQ